MPLRRATGSEISFDATARLATEKQLHPLPADGFSGCFLKGSQVKTFFSFQNGSRGELALVDNNPLFVLIGVPGLPGELRYSAARWVDAAAKSCSFVMAGGYIDDHLVTISPAETACAAAWIQDRVAFLRLGKFMVTFVGNESNLPF